MKKQINEASVRIDIDGLESNDLETLSRMLALAGQAENNVPQMGGMTSIPAITPLDLDSIGGDTQPIMSPDAALSSDDALGGAGSPELDSAVQDLAGSVTDFGEVGLDSDVDNDVEYANEYDDSVDFTTDDSSDNDFDMERMSSLAGIHESVDDEDEEAESIDESLLPDLTLDEDSIATNEDAQSNKEFGPFRTEFECVNDGRQQTNGIEGSNFIVVPKGNAFYWKRTVQEDAENRPAPDFYDNSGIENSRHAYKDKREGTALGDNPIYEDEDGDSVESILESITSRYKKYMESL